MHTCTPHLRSKLLRPGLLVGALALLNPASLSAAESASVGNDCIARMVSWDSGRLSTRTIDNLLGHSQAAITSGDEFALTVCVDGAPADLRLTASDFAVSQSKSDPANTSLDVRLSGKTAPVDVTVRYFAKPGEAWIRKQLLVTARAPLHITKVAVEHLGVPDAYAPYHADHPTARGPHFGIQRLRSRHGAMNALSLVR